MGLFDHTLLRTQPINHIIGLARSTEDALDEIQEAAFGVLTSLLVSELPIVKKQLQGREPQIVGAIVNFMELAAHKCEKPSGDNAAECLSCVVEFSESTRQVVSQDEVMTKIV